MHTLLIDHDDSYTENLAHLIAQVSGRRPRVVNYREVAADGWASYEADRIVLSPGPGRPDVSSDFGAGLDLWREASVPVLGVCLGHQGLGVAFGGRVEPSSRPHHGVVCDVHHEGAGLFKELPRPFRAVQYHSLEVVSVPLDVLEVTAWSEGGMVLGLEHRTRPLHGVQFHPESIGSDAGAALIAEFLGTATRVGPPAEGWPRFDAPAAASPARPTDPGACGAVARSDGARLWWRRSASSTIASTWLRRLAESEEDVVWLDGRHARDAKRSYVAVAGGAFGEGNVCWTYRVSDRRLTIPSDPAHESGRVDLFDALRDAMRRRRVVEGVAPWPFAGGWIGWFGYELHALCGGAPTHDSLEPDAAFLETERFFVFDHEEGTCHAVVWERDESAAKDWLDRVDVAMSQTALPNALDATRPDVGVGGRSPFQFEVSKEQYQQSIAEALTEIRRGESYEICLTNRLRAHGSFDAVAAFELLQQRNPAPYAALLRLGGTTVLSSSPERFLRIDHEGGVETKPIKGTRARGRTADEDVALREELRHSAKDRSEHLMIVDLLRNDLSKVCDPGSVTVPHFEAIESYASVHQMVSTIRGRLRAEVQPIDAVRAAFPGGSMTGAPKLRTLAILDRLERSARGVYSGALGYLSDSGEIDLGIVIRTAVARQGEVAIGTGGAIVADSDPEEEWAEIELKARALREVLEESLARSSAAQVDARPSDAPEDGPARRFSVGP